MSVLCLPSINHCNINDSFEDRCLQKGTQLSSLRQDCNYSTFAWQVCLPVYAFMYVWVLKRTLAAVRHEFSSFISAQKMGRGLFNVESGLLSLCSSSECSSLATLCRRALKWSPGLWRCGIVMTLGLCVCPCVCLHLCIFPSARPSLSSHLHVKSTKCVALKRGSSSFNLRTH